MKNLLKREKNQIELMDDWNFFCTGVFPLEKAIKENLDEEGRDFRDPEYVNDKFSRVILPHTFNDGDIFGTRIEDAGSAQKRCVAFYRKEVNLENVDGKVVLIEFEGVRQTCYLYVNGRLAGYSENGVAPFGMDITPYVHNGKNIFAIATDNTSTRNAQVCIAETPNTRHIKDQKEVCDVEPGSYLVPLEADVPEDLRGVGFEWNCNDFNPVLGGITRPVRLYIKEKVYLTLPLYSNIRTYGTYIYADNFDFDAETADIHVDAEVKNVSGKEKALFTEIIVSPVGDTIGEAFKFLSEKFVIKSVEAKYEKTIVPADAYKKEICKNGKVHFVPETEDKVKRLETYTAASGVIAAKTHANVKFWSIDAPHLYEVRVLLKDETGKISDETRIITGFRHVAYDKDRGIVINGHARWLTGYAGRATNEWAAIGIAPDWLKSMDARLIRESGSNHIRIMHVAGSRQDIMSYDRYGIIATQPAGDKEAEKFNREWKQRVELMRDVIIAFRNHPSIVFWEAGNNSINYAHMKEMLEVKRMLDPHGMRFMGCRTINTEDVLSVSEYVGTMLNRHAARFLAEHGPITETEYSREEAPKRVWDDFTPPDYDYRNLWIGKGGKKEKGKDFYDLTMEDLIIAEAAGYKEFFNDRIGGASHKDLYSAAAGLCWTDSAQHGRQSYSENARMSGRVDAGRLKKQNFWAYRVMQSEEPEIMIVGHWNYPEFTDDTYWYNEKKFDGHVWAETGARVRRDPFHKTVYIVGSYKIKEVRLYKVNALTDGAEEKVLLGTCEKPIETFIFKVDNVDVTAGAKGNNYLYAEGIGFDGKVCARHRIYRAGAEERIIMEIHTSPVGFIADGRDIMYIDLKVVDKDNRTCVLSDKKIEFTCTGPAEFLGGYNSGRFDGYGHNDSVVHKPYIYAECGEARVFLRSMCEVGDVCVTAKMNACGRTLTASASVRSVPKIDTEYLCMPVIYGDCDDEKANRPDSFMSIPEADKLKYEPEDKDYCKILVCGQEPDTRGVRSVNKRGSVWGAVQCILDRMMGKWKGLFTYEYDREKERLTLYSGGHMVIAESHRTHLLVDGSESLMDGEPYVTPEGIFVMEVNAIVPYIAKTTCQYDDKVGVLRIEMTEQQE